VAAIVADRDGLAAPDQLGPTGAESRPAANGQFAGPAVRRAVPAFHGKNAKAVADGAATVRKWLRERRIRTGFESSIERKRNAKRMDVLEEIFRRFETGDTAVFGHDAFCLMLVRLKPRDNSP